MPDSTKRPTGKSEGRKPSQRERFIEKARELGCDEDEASFDEKLRRIGKAKPAKAEKTPAQRGER